MRSDAEIAWAAGLFEGEGCISIKPPQEGGILPSLRLNISMTDRDVLVQFCEIVGCGGVRLRRPEEDGKKAVYAWDIGNRRDVDRLLRAFLPWFGERRAAKAMMVLTECEATDRLCLLCDSPFRGKRSDSRWCSERHRMAWHERQRRLRLAVV